MLMERVKKKVENSTFWSYPQKWKKECNFFLKLDHFLGTFCKKCIFTFENPKTISKNDRTKERPNFAKTCVMTAATCVMTAAI